MIEKATEILQVGIDNACEELNLQCKQRSMLGWTNLRIPQDDSISQSEMFLEELLEAGYDVWIRKRKDKDREWIQIEEISWQHALPGRKGEVLCTGRK